MRSAPLFLPKIWWCGVLCVSLQNKYVNTYSMNRNEVVNKIKGIATLFAPNVKMWLYGSESRGEARPDSDFDVLLLVDAPTLNLQQRMDLIYPFYEIELETGASINPHIETTASWNSRKSVFTEQVKKDRIPL